MSGTGQLVKRRGPAGGVDGAVDEKNEYMVFRRL